MLNSKRKFSALRCLNAAKYLNPIEYLRLIKCPERTAHLIWSPPLPSFPLLLTSPW